MKFVGLFKNGESRLFANGEDEFKAEGDKWKWSGKTGFLNEFHPNNDDMVVSGPYSDPEAYRVVRFIKAVITAQAVWNSQTVAEEVNEDTHECCGECQRAVGLREDMRIRQVY